MTSDYESILKGTHWKTQMDEQDAATLAESKQAVSDAVSKVFITIDRIGRRIHSGFGPDEAVEANEAVTAFLTQLNDMLVGNGGQITASFSNPSMTSVNPTQVHELESRAERAEQELRAVQGNQVDLERSAQRASDLQIQVNELEREQRRLQQEVSTLTDENGQLRGELTTANSDKEAAVASSDAWQSQAEAFQLQLNGVNARITRLQQEKDDAVDAATHWHTIALAHGYEEHPSPDQPDAPDESAAGNQPAAEEPTTGDEPPTRLIDPENGPFNGEQSAAPAAEEPQPRRRLTRPTRRSRRSGSSVPDQRTTNPDQTDH